MIFTLINIVVFLILVTVFLFKFKRKEEIPADEKDTELEVLISKVNSIRYGNLSTKIGTFKENRFNKLCESINRLAETLSDREKMIVEYQNELTKQYKFSEAVLNSLSDGILAVDENFDILYTNPKIEEWFQCEEKEIKGKNISDFIQSKNDNGEIDGEEVFIKNSNDVFLAKIRPLEFEETKEQFVIILKNITDQKEIEQLKDDFVATLTHDLKVPIVAESNIIDFLLEGKFGDIKAKQKEALKNMKHSNAELLELVKILLETYRIDKSEIELVKENICVNSFVKEISNEMSSIIDMEKYGINISSDSDIYVQADKVHFKRVIKNLIQNAVLHSESNKNIDVKVEKDDTNVFVKIIDYGKGINKKDIEHIFKKYYSTAKKFRKIGTGLGLYLSSQIVQAHGGELSVQSEEGVRTEFCIKLPL